MTNALVYNIILLYYYLYETEIYTQCQLNEKATLNPSRRAHTYTHTHSTESARARGPRRHRVNNFTGTLRCVCARSGTEAYAAAGSICGIILPPGWTLRASPVRRVLYRTPTLAQSLQKRTGSGGEAATTRRRCI